MKCIKCKNTIPDGSLYCNYCGKKQVKTVESNAVKVPTPRQLKSGSWFIQLRLGNVSHSITRSTEQECRKEAERLKLEYLNERQFTNSKGLDRPLRLVLDDYINSKSNILSPSSIAEYRRIQEYRFKSVMDLPVGKIRDWQTVCNEELKSVSPNTVKHSWTVVKTALVAAGYAVPKIALPQVVLRDMPYLTPEQIPVFLRAIKGTPVELAALIGLHSLRASEICALTWEKNIDLKNRKIKVDGAVVKDEYGKYIYKETNKTAAAKREIDIFIDDLYYLLLQTEPKTGYIVNLTPANLSQVISHICQKNGLPKIGAHGLRRSFASLAYYLGISERATMNMGGWSDITTVHKRYIKLSQNQIKKENNRIATFYKANKNAN